MNRFCNYLEYWTGSWKFQNSVFSRWKFLSFSRTKPFRLRSVGPLKNMPPNLDNRAKKFVQYLNSRIFVWKYQDFIFRLKFWDFLLWKSPFKLTILIGQQVIRFQMIRFRFLTSFELFNLSFTNWLNKTSIVSSRDLCPIRAVKFTKGSKNTNRRLSGQKWICSTNWIFCKPTVI